MLERLSGPARRAVAHAQTEARRQQHGDVGTEHLVLGILAEGDSAAAVVLAGAGITLDACRDKVAEAVAAKRVEGTSEVVTLTERANRALERAGRLSLRRRTTHVGTVSIMLSVLDVEGNAGQVLRGLSVDLTGLRAALEASSDDPESRYPQSDLSEAPRSPDAQSEVPRHATCPACGTGLAGVLAHRILASSGADGTTRDYAVVYCNACGSAIGTSPA